MILLLITTILLSLSSADTDAERLYDDLINGYNSAIRPVANNSDQLTVKLSLRLSQLIEVVSKEASVSGRMLSPSLPLDNRT